MDRRTTAAAAAEARAAIAAAADVEAAQAVTELAGALAVDAPPIARLRVDRGRTNLPLCECGWRGVPTALLSVAWHQAAEHEERAHIGQDQARQALRGFRRQRAQETPGPSVGSPDQP